MKKTFLILSFTFLFFFLFMPKNTFAKSLNVFPNWVQAYNNTTKVIDRTPAGWSLYNHNYNTFTTTDNSTIISSINWIYENRWTLDLNKNYDVSFRIYQPNVAVSNLDGFNGGKPLVSFENKACWVDFTSSNSTTSNVYGSTFNVLCENVSLNSTTFHIFVDTGPMNTSTTLFGNRYGIGQNWDVTLSNDNSNIESAIDENTQSQKDINDSINDSDTSESQSSAGSFFEDFTSDDYGLSDIITMPLTFIKGLSNASCYSLDLPFPFVDKNVQIPCMTSIYKKYFGSFLTLYQTITTGFIAYWVCVNIYRLVKNFKNPDDDKVEVMEL